MSSIIAGYNYDIFISYRQKDNKYDGWVTEFVENLKKELESMFKDEVSVYFDINPSDYLLETYDVDVSLKDKLKCLVFIPIISRTYCDPKAFAWDNEFKVFIEQASLDQFGLKITLTNGNTTNRLLPVRINDLDISDVKLCESILGGVLRGIDFIYKEPGVNRPLRSNEENPHDNLNHTIYRNQINKVALAIKEIIESIQIQVLTRKEKKEQAGVNTIRDKKNIIVKEPPKQVKINTELKVSSVKSLKKRPDNIFRNFYFMLIGAIILIVGFAGIKMISNQKKKNYAHNVIIPEIHKLVEENFTPPVRAFELATEAEKYIPKDTVLTKLWTKIALTSALHSQPEGAGIFWKDNDKPEDPWKFVGTTPAKNLRVPLAFVRIKIEKDGYDPILLTSLKLLGPGPERNIRLDSAGTLPENMVRIPSKVAPMYIVGLERAGGKLVGEFLIDKYEVTNKEYKKFVDAGGYINRSYWKYPFYKEEKELTWDSAMTLFIDKTGRKGPADWEVGTYPNGQENFPVSGVSWYEASAYAEWSGKQLPTIYHWGIIAETSRSMYIIPQSNFNGKSTLEVGKMKGMSSFGIFDIAGNVREWCYNSTGINGESFALGGGWNDNTYTFNESGSQPSIDRSLSNGFRCMVNLPGDTTLNLLSAPVIKLMRDYNKEKPVDDKTFSIFMRQFDYDKVPLNDQIISKLDTGTWKIEKVKIEVGYNNDYILIYLFLPREIPPPYQAVILYPGSNAIQVNRVSPDIMEGLDFIVKSGRVLVLPILKGTFERRDELKYDDQEETNFYKDRVIIWRKDFGRTIDYLETRSDIIPDKIGYFGASWGGRMGGLMAAVEARLKAVVLHVGGMGMFKSFPEVDLINFLPRVRQPVLMLNGRFDMFFPVETSQIPLFNLLGTPAKDKKMLIYNTGHLVPRTDLIKETLAWYDKYLGPVK